MGQLFFMTLMGLCGLTALARPWIGVVGAYVIAVLTPQAVWWWNFGDVRPALYVLLPTLVGFVIAAMLRKLNFETVKNGRVVSLIILWLWLSLSYWFGQYVHVGGPYRFSDPEWVFATFNKIFLLCLLACVCTDEIRKLKALCVVLLVSAVYLIYWANNQYLSGLVIGRLPGPVDIYGIGTYSDENSFAMLFVVALPFLWYGGQLLQKKYLKYGLWLIIPFGWHAVFLTASRAGLLGIAVTTLFLGLRSTKKLWTLLIIPVFIAAYVYQAGPLMKERAGTISDTTEASSASRLQAWQAALGMIGDHPIVGVGLASFGPAFPEYSTHKPREAHNTILQITAESGIVAGSMYVLIVLRSLSALWANGRRFRRYTLTGEDRFLYLTNEAVLVSLCGMVVCSLFASLQMYEIFYFLFVLTNAVIFLGSRRLAELEQAPGTASEPASVAARAVRGKRAQRAFGTR